MSTAAGWRRVCGCALVSYFRVVTILPVSSVSHNLNATIRQSHTILSTDNISIAGRLMRMLIGGLRVIHCVVKVKGHSWLMVMVLRRRRTG